MLPLYRNIKKRRTELDISQQELAELVGYKSKSMISQVENGTVDLSLTMIAKFASALKCTPSYLMGWEDITDANGVDVMARFGDRLKELRKAQNISQDELAKRLKVTRSNMSTPFCNFFEKIYNCIVCPPVSFGPEGFSDNKKEPA